MKLRKLARQLAAAAVAGAMALSLCMPALAETWDMSNTEKYPNGKGSWISVTRNEDIADHPELNGQFLTIWYSGGEDIKQKDEAPVLSGSFETLGLNCYDGTTVHATLQDAHIEYNADSEHTLTTSGNVELTLSGSNTVTHNNTNKRAIDIDDGGGWPDRTPGLLTIQGSGSLTATNTLSSGIRIQNGTLDVTDGTVNVTAADNGIYALGNTVQVSGGTLCATATGEHGIGINASENGRVTVSGGKLTASGGSYGIVAGQLEMSGGTLNASAKETVAITGSSITVNGGVLNLEDNTAPVVGILSEDLNVTNGWLTAKDQTVSANNITVSGGVMEAGALNCSRLNVSGGWVEADTLEPRKNDASSRTINLSGGNVKLKSVPDSSFTVNFSERARLTITEPVSEEAVSALVEAFKNANAQSDLYTTAYLRYKPTDYNAIPEDVGWDGIYVVYQGTQRDPDSNLATGDNKPLLPSDIVEIGAAPEGDAGGAIAAVVLGSAAVWGGYEVVTRVILNELLPEGAAIPANRGQLALLVWNNAGRPEPAAQPAFADVADADMAKAAQWCAEQGIMEAKSADTFKPEGWTPKFNVIETWNKAFPKH